MKKFDFVIGNPPYQDRAEGTSTSDDPIYNYFMDEAYRISEKTILITPARFLFNAGKTPKSWNKKILNDEHFKVLKYTQKSSNIFRTTDIKGGIAITYYDNSKKFDPIITFSSFEELNSIRKKVVNYEGFENIKSIIDIQSKFNLEELYKDYPEYRKIIGSGGKDKRLRQIIMERLPEIFKENEGKENYKILGLIKKKRAYRYIKKKYIEDSEVIHKYKVFVPAANGSGAIGEVLSTPLIGEPLIGYTQTFISIGCFETYEEANNLLKYIKCKFTRAMLGIKKVTQNNKTKETWSKIPIQDFTEDSDIDWSQSIPEIDQQLYKKYNLSKDEIDFIEEKVQEMK